MKLSHWAKIQGIHYQTAYRWFKAGRIPAANQYDNGTIIVDQPLQNKSTKPERITIYCRVSNQSRKDEIQYQVDRCTTFANAKGLVIHEIYKEIASGMNDRRKIFWKMIESNPTKIIVENKDRLTRFGFEYLERLLKAQECEIIVMNRDKEDESDLIKDLVSIITSFCCRLYGLTRGINKAKKLKQELLNEQK